MGERIVEKAALGQMPDFCYLEAVMDHHQCAPVETSLGPLCKSSLSDVSRLLLIKI